MPVGRGCHVGARAAPRAHLMPCDAEHGELSRRDATVDSFFSDLWLQACLTACRFVRGQDQDQDCSTSQRASLLGRVVMRHTQHVMKRISTAVLPRCVLALLCVLVDARLA